MAYEDARPIKGWNNYRVEQDGTMWSTQTANGKPKQLTRRDKVTMSRPGDRKQFLVANLVAEAFGPHK